MVINLACKYSARNSSAFHELVGLGYESLLDYALENLTTDKTEADKCEKQLLTLSLINSRDFRTSIFRMLKNRLRNYTVKMSSYSETFPELYSEKRAKKRTVSSYGNMVASDANGCSLYGEYCPVEPCDDRCAIEQEMVEILADASRFLNSEELKLLSMKLNGVSVKEIASLFNVSCPAISQRIKTIAGKLTPLGESLKSAA